MAETATTGRRQTNGWGIDLNYEDAFGKWHDVPQASIDVLLNVMGAGQDTAAPSGDSVIVLSGPSRKLPADATIQLETGETMTCRQNRQTEIPNGYHQAQFDGENKVRPLIVSPGRCWLPDELRTWGWSTQLYASRSRESWGIGDLGDLARLAKWSASNLGAGMMMINPLSASSPLESQQPSPYYPSSRRFLNPLWLRIEWVPGATADRIPQIDELARAGRDLNRQRLIDRDKIFKLKMQALDLLWGQFKGDPAFDSYCNEHGTDLERFAIFCALAEHHGSGWHSWPDEFHHPHCRK